MYTVLMNGKPIGIKESNYAYALWYWASRCTPERKFTVRGFNSFKA